VGVTVGVRVLVDTIVGADNGTEVGVKPARDWLLSVLVEFEQDKLIMKNNKQK